MSRAAFADAHGADALDIARVEAFASDHGLTVVDAHAGRRSVILSGNAAAMNEAFGVQLMRAAIPGGEAHTHAGPVTIADLGGIVEAVLGLDTQPIAAPHRRVARGKRDDGAAFNPTDLAQLYDFPAGLDGSDQCVAILELGGGYRAKDLSAYFAKLGLKMPSVTAVLVGGAKNAPSTPDSADSEVALDIEIAGGVAPGARYAVYFAPNTLQGFVDAITTAVHDTTRKPYILSISWGSAECGWPAQAINALNSALQDASALGVTVCVATGDSGSSDGVDDGNAHADFPASSPYVLACGGRVSRRRAVSSRARRSGTTARGRGPAEVGSATCSIFLRGKRTRPFPRRRTPAGALDAACPTWPATQTPRPDTTCSLMASGWWSEGRARWRGSGPGSSRGSTSRSEGRSAT